MLSTAMQTIAAKCSSVPALKNFTQEQTDNFMDDVERYVMGQYYLKYVCH